MANDAIEFYRQIVLKHIDEVKSTISDTKYRVYIAIVNECTDLETLKNMADFGMQDEFIEYSKGIDKRLGEYNTTVKELQEVYEGGYEITNLDEIKREELRKKRGTTQAEVADTIDKVLHSYDEYGDTIEALSKLEQIDDESEYGIEVRMELNVDDFDDEEITEDDIERENETYEDEIEDIEELDEDDEFEDGDSIEEEFDEEELEDEDVNDIEELEEDEEELEEDEEELEEDEEELEDEDEENGEPQGEYWYYDDGEYYDDYDEEEYKEDPKTVEELYDEIGNDTDYVEESSLDVDDSSLFDFEDEDDTEDSDEEYPDEDYEDDTYDENDDYFDELEDSDSIEENDSINMDENEDYVGISETLEFEDDTQEEPEEYLDDDQYEVDEEEDGEEDEEYLEDESESEIEENGMEFDDDLEDDTDEEEDTYGNQFEFEEEASDDFELEDDNEDVYRGEAKKESRPVKTQKRQKGEVFDTSTAHGKQAQDTLKAMTKMFNTAGKQGKKVNNYFEKWRNTMKRKMIASGKRNDGKPSMFNLSDNIDLD